MSEENQHAVIMTPDPQAGPPVRAAVIWLHGLGANGYDFVPVVRELGLPEKGVRTVLPHAPEMPVTINGGYVMPAWYDIYAPDLGQRQDEAGIRRSSEYLSRLIDEQLAQGLQAEQVVLAGFSQGGAIALHCGLRYSRPLAGILALSTYLPLAATLAQEMSPASRQTPIWMGHGEHDPVVPLAAAHSSEKHLRNLGFDVEWRTYPMQHSVHPGEVRDMGAWLDRALKLTA